LQRGPGRGAAGHLSSLAHPTGNPNAGCRYPCDAPSVGVEGWHAQ
jgi:hypothetical protein